MYGTRDIRSKRKKNNLNKYEDQSINLYFSECVSRQQNIEDDSRGFKKLNAKISQCA